MQDVQPAGVTGALHYATLPRAAPARVLACGADLKNAACLIDGDRVIWSAPHGNLANHDNCDALRLAVTQLVDCASGPVHAVAHDLHPDFYSSRVAQVIAARLGVPAIAVQHHHAHIAVAQAEQGIEGGVIGLALDGVGLGSDGMPWGGEILWVDAAREAQHWQRLAHLALLESPGGDNALLEPWRMAAAALHGLGRGHEIAARFGASVGLPKAQHVQGILHSKSNCPRSSSGGRWFDAAAAALGLVLRQTFEAEAAIRLEQYATAWLATRPDFDVVWDSLDLLPLMSQLFALPTADASEHYEDARGAGAALFHVALANGLAHHAIAAARSHAVQTVVLGGGCFLNQILCARLRVKLGHAGLAVVQPGSVSCCDAGIALGQAWIAACTIHPSRGVQPAKASAH